MSRRIAYTVTLTADEYRSLQWLQDHGYAADMIKHASEDTEQADGSHVLGYYESDAWNVWAEAYPDTEDGGSAELDEAFSSCASPSLRGKMFAFLDGIV